MGMKKIYFHVKILIIKVDLYQMLKAVESCFGMLQLSSDGHEI